MRPNDDLCPPKSTLQMRGECMKCFRHVAVAKVPGIHSPLEHPTVILFSVSQRVPCGQSRPSPSEMDVRICRYPRIQAGSQHRRDRFPPQLDATGQHVHCQDRSLVGGRDRHNRDMRPKVSKGIVFTLWRANSANSANQKINTLRGISGFRANESPSPAISR